MESVAGVWEILTTILFMSSAIQQHLESVIRPFGASLADLRMLVAIPQFKGAPQKTLAARLGLSEPVVSTRLDRLERAGWVVRAHVGHRRVNVRLTDAGKQFLRDLVEAVEHSPPSQAISHLSLWERYHLVEDLQLLLKGLSGSFGQDGQPTSAWSGAAPDPFQPFLLSLTRASSGSGSR